MAKSNLSKLAFLAKRLVQTAWRHPAGLRPILGYALAGSEAYADPEWNDFRIPLVRAGDLADVNGEPLEASVHLFPGILHSISPMESLAIGLLLQRIKAQRIFEFGTHRGVSTTQLLINSAPHGHVFTLDLPRNDRSTAFAIDPGSDHAVAVEPMKADLIPTEYRERLTLLESDSALFDESPYAESMDAVFVDGAHIYQYVKNDTEKAIRMLRPGGLVIWHDCRPQNPDVMRYIVESKLKAQRVQDTSIGFATKPA